VGCSPIPSSALITRFLKQSKGTDPVTVPSVVTKSGQKASIRVVREFPLPDGVRPAPGAAADWARVTIGNVNYSTGSNAGPVTDHIRRPIS